LTNERSDVKVVSDVARASTPKIPGNHSEESSPRPQDWAWAEWALKQTECEATDEEQSARAQGNFTKAFYLWRFAFVSFRKTESAIMFGGIPNEADLNIHRYIGTTLVAQGMHLAVLAEVFEAEFLDSISFNRRIVDQMINSLEDTLDAFHSSKNPKRVNTLEERIFSGKA